VELRAGISGKKAVVVDRLVTGFCRRLCCVVFNVREIREIY
jgi:hypothetical protein